MGATINNLTTLGLTASDILFSGNQLFVNVEGLPFNRNSFVRLDLVVTGGPISEPPSSVPEPGSLALISLGLAGVIVARRRKQTP